MFTILNFIRMLMQSWHRFLRYLIFLFVAFEISLLVLNQAADAQNNLPARQIHIPYWGEGNDNTYPDSALLWFGQVTPTSNYTDARMSYDDENLKIITHIIDRRLWQDANPNVSDLTNWDAVSVYLDLDGNVGQSPDTNAYHFIIQQGTQLNDNGYQAVYRGNGASWDLSSIPFSSSYDWRGNGFNDDIDDKGWTAYFTIPFTSLGLSGPPPKNDKWGIAITIHDRDDNLGTPITDQIWPELMDPNAPATWGQLAFGIPRFTPGAAVPGGVEIIQEGLNGTSVPDGHVGGHTTCGEGIDHWSEWGEANYAGYEQINIQNQWDIADYPCFSKYYVTFPLETLPLGKVVLSAKLTLNLFGNAGGGNWGPPPDSFIQVFSITDEWNENTLTWNNAPLASENFAGTRIQPVQPGQENSPHPYVWDVSEAVTKAYTSGEPVRLALYSADGPMHTGKYFWSSNVGDWNASGRPTLEIVWGDDCTTVNIECHFTYLPLVKK